MSSDPDFVFRIYSFMVDLELEEIVLVTIANDNSAMLCIDEILINEKKAFLINNLIGHPNSADCTRHVEACTTSSYAVLSWPVCSAEVINQRTETEITGESQSNLITAVCFAKQLNDTCTCTYPRRNARITIASSKRTVESRKPSKRPPSTPSPLIRGCRITGASR